MVGQLQIGPQVNQDGDIVPIRGGRFGEAISQLLHGRYYESAQRGNVFVMYASAAGVDAYTNQNQISGSIWNASNAVMVSILAVAFATAGTPSATAALGFTGYGVQVTTPTGTVVATAAGCGKIGNAIPQSTAYRTASYTTAGNFFFPVISIELGAITKLPSATCFVDIGGAIIAPPYSWVGFASSAATTFACHVGIIYEEIPV